MAILDQWGRPIETGLLTEEIGSPTITGVRTPMTGYPGDGLDPSRLGSLLKAADGGNPIDYLELAETVEERDLHYAGVLSARKRQVSQLEITVEPASEDALAIEQADRVTAWLKRDELADEIFDMLDAVGKGYSFTEIIWNSSSGQWQPERLEWRDPRWFRFAIHDMRTPLLLDEGGQELPLPGFKFIRTQIRAKSGIPVRSGLARIVSWAWMFKAFTQRDWAIFTQNFGQPVRLGKYGAGATKDDRRTLFNAVANIAGDCAAIIPESMTIEFVENKTGSTSLALYKERSDWLDQQVSKAVLGQTATTDAIAGGHAVGKEHRQVQEDIERADARSLSAVINRDLIRPWMILEFGTAEHCPRLRIGRAEQTDVKATVDAVGRLVPLGLKVGQNQMREVVGLSAPADDDELLGVAKTNEDDETLESETTRLSAGRPPEPLDAGQAAVEAGLEKLKPGMDGLLGLISGLVDRAGSMEEVRAMLEEAIETGDTEFGLADIEDAFRQTLLLAELTGRVEVGNNS